MDRINPKICYLIAIIVILSMGFIYFKDAGLRSDEKPHYNQTEHFVNGNYTVIKDLTTIPGYHAVVSGLARATGTGGIQSIRFFTFAFGILSVFLIYLIVQKIASETDQDSIVKTWEYSFMPLLTPFFFLIFTDVLSLFLVLLAFYFMMQKKHAAAGFISILSIAVRQNNIIWLLFVFSIYYYENYRFNFNIKIIKKEIKKSWTFLLGTLLFIIFVILNKGVSLKDKVHHPAFQVHAGNIFFMLFLFFFLFLPMNITNFRKIKALLMKDRTIIIFISLFFLYMLTFVNNHPFNIDWGEYILRNRILIFFTSTIWLKALFFIPVFYSILSIAATELRRRSYYLLYPFTLLFLAPSWLIEQRYYLIPLSFFIIFKKEKVKWTEILTIIIWMIISAWLIHGIKLNLFFL